MSGSATAIRFLLSANINNHREPRSSHVRTIPLIDRYDSLFWGYQSPPYVTARPEVTVAALDDVFTSLHSSDGGNSDTEGRPPSILGILESDGLWDLVNSDAAVQIVSEALIEGNLADGENVAQALMRRVVVTTGKHPGDDVTILVLIL